MAQPALNNETLCIISLAIGLFGGTFAFLASLQIFFRGYITKAYEGAGNLCKAIKSATKNKKTKLKANGSHWAVLIVYWFWNATLLATIIVFGSFIFRVSFDISSDAHSQETIQMWNKYLEQIIYMRNTFLCLCGLGILWLLIIWRANSWLISMSGIATEKQQESAFKDNNPPTTPPPTQGGAKGVTG